MMDNKIVVYIFTGVALITAACKSNTSNKNNDSTGNNNVKTEAKTSAVKDSTHLIGVWLDQEIKTEKGEQIAYELVSQGKKTYIQVITFNGKKLNVNDNPDISTSASEIKKSGEKYVNPKSPSESYGFDKNNNLLIYDETGLVAVCKKAL